MYRNEPPGALSHRNSRFQKPSNHTSFAWTRCMRPPAFFPRRRIMSNRFSSQGLGPLVRRPPLLDYTQSQQSPLYENFHNIPNYRQKFCPPNPIRNSFPAGHNFSEQVNPNVFFPVPVHGSFESESSHYGEFNTTNKFSTDLPINEELWIETMAPNGKTYYYNAKSRVAQWNKPENVRVMSLQHLKTLANAEISVPPRDANVTCSPIYSQPHLGTIPPHRHLSPGAFFYPQQTFPIRRSLCHEHNLAIIPQLINKSDEHYYNTDEMSIPFSEQWIPTNTLQINESESNEKLDCKSNVSAIESFVKNESDSTSDVTRPTENIKMVGNEFNVAMETGNAHDEISEQKLSLERKDLVHENSVENVITNTVSQPTNTVTPQEDKSRPVSSTPISASKWCVVWTGDNKVFFYDVENKISVWEVPVELMHRRDVHKLIEAPPFIVKTKEMNSESKPNIKKIKTEKEVVSTDEASSINSVVKKENSNELVEKVSKERENIPHETRVELFQQMLVEKNVSAFSTWEKELHKIVFDSRYLLLTPKERKQKFELYIKDKLEADKDKIKKEARDTRERFRTLLREAKVTSKTRFVDFARHYQKDLRYKAVEKLKDKESIFGEFIKCLCTSEPETAENQNSEKFLELLKEQTCINKDSQWSDINKKISNDARYKAISSEQNRRELFKDYLKGVSTELVDITKEKELREMASIQNRKEEVERDLSIHMKKLQKERELHKHESTLECYKALLIDLVLNPKCSWRDAKKILKDDQRWESVRDLSHDDQEYFFEKHLSNLISKKKEQFRQLLNSISEITLDSSWRDVRKLILKDSRSKLFSKDEAKCEKEFKEYMKDRVKTAKNAFKELLKETKTITHASKSLLKNENYLQNLESILSNDKRYLVLECFNKERKDMLLSYIDKLHCEGPPQPPTASNPKR